MIDLLFTFGAVAERRTMLTDRPFNDSQDCLTFLERQLEGPRRRQDETHAEHRTFAPWRSL